ncbi:hypothetical protein NDU88_002206 [Pleurodeles waltl]|uniref:Uncharacterized protein n=1 Tax=Pleurodeles waltl TaxID=8319 RepID=A0AAV7MN65_PLEWA|nr:hypothetical protein NDU88_002206 [Pleurodeles waltl]
MLQQPLFPRRGIRATFFRVRRNSSAARYHQTAPAVLQATSDAINHGAHIRVFCDRCSLQYSAAAATAACHAPRVPEQEAL